MWTGVRDALQACTRRWICASAATRSRLEARLDILWCSRAPRYTPPQSTGLAAEAASLQTRLQLSCNPKEKQPRPLPAAGRNLLAGAPRPPSPPRPGEVSGASGPLGGTGAGSTQAPRTPAAVFHAAHAASRQVLRRDDDGGLLRARVLHAEHVVAGVLLHRRADLLRLRARPSAHVSVRTQLSARVSARSAALQVATGAAATARALCDGCATVGGAWLLCALWASPSAGRAGARAAQRPRCARGAVGM